ncbi:unnamed protein product [Oppiella nova]|uniref:Phosphoribosyltransferase domain-containing protein n=1 Tax=Oppiella nova TaxID=334625 RepID=A0A7R9LJJ5_9ACAR|nr:unnamed protein product [Oppiella nova]CAG2164181.1 unnamed protein product [Oppiella nova]
MAIGEPLPDSSSMVNSTGRGFCPALKRWLAMSLDQNYDNCLIRSHRTTSRSDFIFYADRLVSKLLDPFGCGGRAESVAIEGHRRADAYGCHISHLEYIKKSICGVSIVRSGEAMEKGLRDCCQSIRKPFYD